MKSYKKAFSAILAATIIATSAAFTTSAVNDENVIFYEGTAYSKDNLSEETIKWLEVYNVLSDEGRQTINYVPYELRQKERSSFKVYEAGYDMNTDNDIAILSDPPYILSTSGGEPVFNPTYWNDPDRIKKANCYAYAMDVICGKDTLLQPGELAGSTFTTLGFNGILTAAQKDGPYLGNGRTLTACSAYSTSTNKSYKVALVTTTRESEKTDFHWYVQNSSGYWSHKRGHSVATQYDASGNYIYDPQVCDKFYWDRDAFGYYHSCILENWGGYIMVTRW